MQTQTEPPRLGDFLDPAGIKVAVRGFGCEEGTCVAWDTDTWTGAGDPSRVRRGVVLRGYLDGTDIGRTAIEGATDLGDPEVQTAVQSMKQHLIAAHGHRYLAALQDEIDSLGDPQLLLAKDPVHQEAIYRRARENTAPPSLLALIAEVQAKEKTLLAVRRRYAVTLWRYIAHLYRHGLPAKDIAHWTGVSAASTERRITSVPTAGAAAITGVEQKTWSGYVARDQAPAPDDHVGREPVWHISTVLRHVDTRPGRPGRPPKQV
ncbi:hypothetical protein ABVB69_32265 [Streptomyces sp. NPDC000349]|uniref:hypothetical protein n=1 Tax=unclassified Streptomyces TaxID=2593676 RepID=UPI0027838625|nr:hypothetical protein [Streptomyces sp. DSM 40167]MDQ0408872.1 hypothetical protein [Streptomyces sp. DSM 40167]